ncbi:hypothetical protein [Roseicella frigidaeris]|nr:hypothetical protein [Roseicella frigidaeris]
MRGMGGTAARVTLLGIGVLLGGCSWFDNGSARVADGIGDFGGRIGMPWGSSHPKPPEESTTIARLTGAPTEVTPLRTEDGDVWPVPEAPRSTLANPDAAMRGIPNYRPGDYDRPPISGEPRPLPPNLRSGASSPPPLPPVRTEPQQQSFVPPAGDTRPPARRNDGRVIVTPNGSAAVTTGGTDRIQGYVLPGGASGTAINDGATTTLVGPNGQVQVVPNQR